MRQLWWWCDPARRRVRAAAGAASRKRVGGAEDGGGEGRRCSARRRGDERRLGAALTAEAVRRAVSPRHPCAARVEGPCGLAAAYYDAWCWLAPGPRHRLPSFQRAARQWRSAETAAAPDHPAAAALNRRAAARCHALPCAQTAACAAVRLLSSELRARLQRWGWQSGGHGGGRHLANR